MIDMIMEPVGLLLDWLKMFLSLSVTIGGIMVEVLKWLCQYSSHILSMLRLVRILLLWAIDITWLVTGVTINLSVIAGGWLIQCVFAICQIAVITMEYCYYGISFLPILLYNFVTQGFSVAVSMATSSWYFLQESIWPLIVHCVTFVLSFIASGIILLYDMLCVLWEYVVTTVVTVVQFSQDSILPYMITICSGLFYVLLSVVNYCYTTIIAIIYYVTNLTLQVIELLPGAFQPVTTDLVHYISDFISSVITVIFDILSYFISLCIKVVELILTSPAFWALLVTAIILSTLFCWFSKHWLNRRPEPVVIVDAHPVVTAEERQAESREGRNRTILNSVAAHQSSVSTSTGDAVKKMEKLEEEMLCVVCQANKKNILLQPCNHVCLCPSCVKEVMRQNTHCPLCRKRISSWTKVYL